MNRKEQRLAPAIAEHKDGALPSGRGKTFDGSGGQCCRRLLARDPAPHPINGKCAIGGSITAWAAESGHHALG
jgi:hypothetical protein